MANITDRDKTFIQNALDKGYDNNKAFNLLNRARTRNGLPELKQEGKVAEFFTGIGKGLYGIGSQLSRLAPGDQSADPNSYYNRSQELMRGADVERQMVGQDPNSMTSKVGQFVGETLPTIPLSMGASAVANVGLKGLASVAPRAASRVSPFLSLGLKPTMGNVAKFGAVEGAKDTAIYDMLTKGKTSLGSVALGATAGSVLGMGLRGLGKLGSRADDLSINKSKTGAYTESNFADRLSTKFNRLDPTKEVEFKKMTGEEVGQFLNKRGIKTAGTQTVGEVSDLFQKSIQEADDGLALIQGKFKMQGGDDYVGIAIDDLQKKMTSELSKDRGLINSLAQKYQAEGLSQTELNQLKRLYQQNNKFGYLKEAIDPTGVARATNVLDGIRDWQFKTASDNGFTNLGAINKNTQAYKFISRELSKKLDKASGNNAISLTDWIVATGSPYGFSGVVAKKLLSTETAKSLLLKGLTRGKKTIPSIEKASRADIIKKQIQKVYGLSDNDYSDLSFSSTLDRKGLKTLPPPSGKPTTTSGVIDVKPQVVGPRGANPPEITSRSKIVQPGTYTETKPVVKSPGKKVNNAIIAPIVKEAKKYKTAEKFIEKMKKKVWDKDTLKNLKPIFENKSQREIGDILRSIYNTGKLPEAKKIIPRKPNISKGVNMDDIPF